MWREQQRPEQGQERDIDAADDDKNSNIALSGAFLARSRHRSPRSGYFIARDTIHLHKKTPSPAYVITIISDRLWCVSLIVGLQVKDYTLQRPECFCKWRTSA